MANILIGISGSIAAYKMADVVSQLTKRGHAVQIVLTASAREFITPLVLETLSGRAVKSALLGDGVSGTEHIEIARWADIYVIAPATANVLARLALGLADDLLTTVALATEAPLLIAPAMNTVMWNKDIVRTHVATLSGRGVQWVEPGTGVLACGEEGVGKLASVEDIIAAIEHSLAPQRQILAGQHLLVTAGPTTTAIDAVRYITNHSTGRMGAAVAEAALALGARVTLVMGTDKGVVDAVPPPGTAHRYKLIKVNTAEQMLKEAMNVLPSASGVVASAAVMDYSVAHSAAGKLKRSAEGTSLDLVPSPDVLKGLRDAARSEQWFLGFAAETDDVEENAQLKLSNKKLDFVFANTIARHGENRNSGFAVATNGGLLLGSAGERVELPVESKQALAFHLLQSVHQLLSARKSP